MNAIRGGCVRIPSGWMTVSGPTLKMPRGDGRYFTFEVHPYCGPVRCHAVTGDPTKFDFQPDSVFWPLYYRWELGGAQVDAYSRCVLPELTPEMRRAVEVALADGLVAARGNLTVGSLPTTAKGNQ